MKEYRLLEKYLSVIEKAPGTSRQYLGQPDMVLLEDDRTLLTVYPGGHGAGPVILQVSNDAGEMWQEKTDTPASWQQSLETPTLYRLDAEKIILICGRPDWKGNQTGGWQTSLSHDNGVTWSEFKTHHSTFSDGRPNFTNVAMASLIPVQDEDGKWLGVYHDNRFVNYRTFLTFDAAGQEQWSEPEAYLAQYRELEKTYQICEVGLFRSPDQSRIMALGRTQSHQHPSVWFYSEDEGLTWSEPSNVHPSLQGERHKAVYDPISNRLVVTFREISLGSATDDWLAGDWLAWVGTYENLINQEPGTYRIRLAEDWTNTPKSGDSGYAGIVVQRDGTFILDSYGHWDKDFSRSWPHGVLSDLSYILQAKFKLEEIEYV